MTTCAAFFSLNAYCSSSLNCLICCSWLPTTTSNLVLSWINEAFWATFFSSIDQLIVNGSAEQSKAQVVIDIMAWTSRSLNYYFIYMCSSLTIRPWKYQGIFLRYFRCRANLYPKFSFFWDWKIQVGEFLLKFRILRNFIFSQKIDILLHNCWKRWVNLAQVLRKIGYFKPDAIFEKRIYEMIIKTHPLNISKNEREIGWPYDAIEQQCTSNMQEPCP